MTIPAVEIYSHQGNPAFEAALAARTASHDAAFFMPHLRPGMQLLDVGCGPGSITLGFAEVVAPGQVVGVDIQSAQVELARTAALARGQSTIHFEVANAYSLPFPDDSFDAVFANGILMHLREPARSLAELRRVLRPGGIAGIRDPDWGASIHVPTTPRLEQWFAARLRARLHNGGDPFLGRHYRRLLQEAGFSRVEAGASVETAGTAEETQCYAAFLQAQLQGFAATVVAQGWMDQSSVVASAAEINAWAQRSYAFAATVWCHAIGR